MANFQITSREAKSRVGFILLGVFAFYIALELREVINVMFPNTNPIVIGVIGIIAVLFLFDF